MCGIKDFYIHKLFECGIHRFSDLIKRREKPVSPKGPAVVVSNFELCSVYGVWNDQTSSCVATGHQFGAAVLLVVTSNQFC